MSDYYEGLPMDVEQDAEIVASVVAAEAVDLWTEGIDIGDIPTHPRFQARTAGLVTPEIIESASDYAEQIASLQKLMEDQVKLLMDKHGCTEVEARKIVNGELLKAFVQGQVDKAKEE